MNLIGFTRFYLVLLSFKDENDARLQFYLVLPSFTRFYLVLLSFT